MSGIFADFHGLAVAEGPIVDAGPELDAVEREVVACAVPARVREFSTGRMFARRLLEGLGAGRPAVPQSPDRSPRWPAGFVGSIAHTDSHCLVVVGRTHDFDSIGVDLEPAKPLEEELFETIATTGEWAEILRLPEEERGLAVRRLFTAKEAVYKCVHPILSTFLEFQEITITFGPGGRSFTGTVSHPRASDLEVEGRIGERSGFLHALAVMRVKCTENST